MRYKEINITNRVQYRGNFRIMVIIPVFLIIVHTSCKKLVETPPPSDQISESNVFSTDATAIAAINNLYISMNGQGSGQPMQGTVSISLLTGLSGDELTLYSGITFATPLDFYKNTLSTSRGSGSEHWAPLYNYIFQCNAAIEALNSSQSNGLTPIVKKQLLGEVQLLRGFFYFLMVNLYGDVPLCVTTDPEVNTLLARSPKANVYQQIISDLLLAENNLSADFLNGTLTATTTERVRPTRWAAEALLAKAYLYAGDYAKAEQKATEVINNTTLFSLAELNKVFLKNSSEAIWQLQPTAINFNTVDAQTYILPASGPDMYNYPVYLSDILLNSFEPGDLRAQPKNWIDTITVGTNFYHFSYKYKLNQSDPNITTSTGTQNMQEYFMMLRLGEQYLIRAEARAQQNNNMAGAIEDLDKVRWRAGLPLIETTDPGINKTALLDKILHERQVELFTEWGNRWFDLKRTGNIDAVMSAVTPQKSGGTTSWQSYQQVYPIPRGELQKAPYLVQNPEYN